MYVLVCTGTYCSVQNIYGTYMYVQNIDVQTKIHKYEHGQAITYWYLPVCTGTYCSVLINALLITSVWFANLLVHIGTY